MSKIVTPEKIDKLTKLLHDANKKVVVAGGCFDILHPGHIAFLTAAKQQGDILIVLLESDESIRKFKGPDRPFFLQADRSNILSALSAVDYIIPLPGVLTDKDYDELILTLKPAIIATTKGDTARIHKERQGKLIGATVMDVTDRLPDYSTSKIAQHLSEL